MAHLEYHTRLAARRRDDPEDITARILRDDRRNIDDQPTVRRPFGMLPRRQLRWWPPRRLFRLSGHHIDALALAGGRLVGVEGESAARPVTNQDTVPGRGRPSAAAFLRRPLSSGKYPGCPFGTSKTRSPCRRETRREENRRWGPPSVAQPLPQRLPPPAAACRCPDCLSGWCRRPATWPSGETSIPSTVWLPVVTGFASARAVD